MMRALIVGTRTVVVVLLAATIGLMLGLGTASAYFKAAGLGAGGGSTGTTIAVTLAPGTVNRSLYPGGSATVTTVASNPNSTAVTIPSLALDTSSGTGGFAVDPDHSGCGLTTFSFTTQTNGGSGWTIPANSDLAIALPGSVAASSATGNACQGANLTVHLRSAP